MKDQLEKLKKEAILEISKASEIKALRDVEIIYLGRKGKLTGLLRQVKNISAELKPVIGRLANEVKIDLENAVKETELKISGTRVKKDNYFDPTLPGSKPAMGHLHPVTQMTEKIWDIFRSMNYEIVDGPEVETDYYNFQALNVPKNHPARDMQATYYLKDAGKISELLLRTHTSSASQVRAMEKRKPPVRIITVGKCYRRDDDLRHTPMFHQFDGVVIDHDITFADLKGTLHMVMKKLLEKDLNVRFRVSYFPFVEPCAEFDVSCTICDGRGCPTCKNTGWLEIGGCGMIHPNVLKAAKYDPDKWQGFAFGFGVERTFMIKHQIPGIKIMFENDLRFLEQF